MKILRTVWNWVQFLLTGKGPVADEAIQEGLIDYSGEGRDENGK